MVTSLSLDIVSVNSAADFSLSLTASTTAVSCQVEVGSWHRLLLSPNTLLMADSSSRILSVTVYLEPQHVHNPIVNEARQKYMLQSVNE